MSFYKLSPDSEPFWELKKKAKEIGALPPEPENPYRKGEPLLIAAIEQAHRIESEAHNSTVYDPKTKESHEIKAKDITSDEALTVALILHVRYWRSKGFKLPINEGEIVERLGVDSAHVSEIIKGRKAEFFSSRF
ncbi:MAG TPA: hypothetical protein VJH90_01770 [archaeon]|nr:hypothetical protein [archaeon]